MTPPSSNSKGQGRSKKRKVRSVLSDDEEEELAEEESSLSDDDETTPTPKPKGVKLEVPDNGNSAMTPFPDISRVTRNLRISPRKTKRAAPTYVVDSGEEDDAVDTPADSDVSDFEEVLKKEKREKAKTAAVDEECIEVQEPAVEAADDHEAHQEEEFEEEEELLA